MHAHTLILSLPSHSLTRARHPKVRERERERMCVCEKETKYTTKVLHRTDQGPRNTLPKTK